MFSIEAALASYCLFCPWLFVPGSIVSSKIAFSDLGLLYSSACLIANGRFRWSTIGALVVAFLMVVFATSIFATPTPTTTILIILRLTGIFMPLLLLFSAVRHRPVDFRRIVLALWIGTMLSLLAGAALFHFGVQTRDNQQVLWVGSVRAGFRAAGLTGNTAEFGQIAALFFLCSVLLSGYITRKYKIIVISFGIGLFTYISIVSSSRGAVLDVLVGLATYYVFVSLSNPRRIIINATIVVLAIAIVFVTLYQLKGMSVTLDATLARLDFLGLVYEAQQWNVRFSSWQYVWANIGDNYFLGIGIRNVMDRYNVIMDNSLLTILIEHGIIGVALYAIIIITLAGALVRRALRLDDKVASAMLAILAGFVAHGFTIDAHTSWAATPSVFAIICAYLLVTPSREAGTTFAGPDQMRRRAGLQP